MLYSSGVLSKPSVSFKVLWLNQPEWPDVHTEVNTVDGGEEIGQTGLLGNTGSTQALKSFHVVIINFEHINLHILDKRT